MGRGGNAFVFPLSLPLCASTWGCVLLRVKCRMNTAAKNTARTIVTWRYFFIHPIPKNGFLHRNRRSIQRPSLLGLPAHSTREPCLLAAAGLTTRDRSAPTFQYAERIQRALDRPWRKFWKFKGTEPHGSAASRDFGAARALARNSASMRTRCETAAVVHSRALTRTRRSSGGPRACLAARCGTCRPGKTERTTRLVAPSTRGRV